MRFRIDSPAIPARKFVLPADELATAPAPLPALGKPFKPRVWGAGVPTAADKRRLAAQKTPKRTSRRPVEAQMAARGLYTVSAPVGPRKGRKVLEFTAADDSPMVAFLGTLALRINPDSVDLGRVAKGIMSLAIDHNTSELMGRITEATIHEGRLDMRAEVSNTATATEVMSEIDDLTRAGFSPGFLIHETKIIDPDHPDYDENAVVQIEVTRWEPYEISSSAVPRNPNARLRGVASMNSNGTNVLDDAIMDVPELVSREDLTGLSLAAARKVLDSGKGSAAQRAKLKQFFALFDAGLENGLSRDLAATAAKAASGI